MIRKPGGRSRARALAYYRRRGRHADAAAVRAQMREAEQCEECGAHLSDPLSVERGLGPDCWAKVVERADATS